MNIIISQNQNEFTVVKISLKKFDFEALQEAKEIIIDAVNQSENKKIILDLSTVEFMDSMGLSLIIGTLKYIEQVDGQMKLAPLAKQPNELISIAHTCIVNANRRIFYHKICSTFGICFK